MPILVSPAAGAMVLGDAAVVTLPGGLVFNEPGNEDWAVDIPEWHHGIPVEVTVVPRGGGRGGRVTRHRETDRYYTVTGGITVPLSDTPADMEGLRSLLVAAFSIAEERPLDVRTDITRRAWVRLYDTPDVDWRDNHLTFTLPLVATDPLKYAAMPLSGVMGAFAGGSLYLAYTADGLGGYYTTYPEPGPSQTYRDEEPSGAYPDVLTLDSVGDVTSRRLVVQVTGPLEAGDWWLVNEALDEALSVEQSLAAGQTLTLDSYLETADIDGSPVDSLVTGDWLSLAPGSNTYRLMVGTRNTEAYAEVTAFEGMR
jgi:hypothetical protein